MASRSRGLGITSKDMEASRLVFVFVKDSKPRRKVAIPVPDSYTLEQFLAQVKTKLKLSGIADIYFSATGVKVTNVNDLQDIDELCVVEGADAAAAAPAAANGHAASAASQRSGAELNGNRQNSLSPHGDAVLSPTSMLQQRQQSMQPERHKVVVSTDGLMPSTSASYADEEDHKYARRAHPLRRTLQRLFPNMFAPGLPVTNRDAQLESSADGGGPKGSRRRRVRRSPYNLGNLLLVLFTMACVVMMLYLFFWVSSSPTMADMSRPAARPAAAADSDAGSSLHQAAQAAAAGAAEAVAGAVQQPAAVVKQPESVVGAVTGAGLAGQAAGSIAAGGGAALQAASGAAEAAGRAAAVH